MSFLVFLLMAMKKKINLSDRLILKEALNQEDFSSVINLLIRIFKYTLFFELIGAVLLATVFVPEYGIGKGCFYSIFHSISAFCNAGIDILGDNSLINYSCNTIVSITIMLLIIIGRIRFYSMERHSRWNKEKNKRKTIISKNNKRTNSSY